MQDFMLFGERVGLEVNQPLERFGFSPETHATLRKVCNPFGLTRHALDTASEGQFWGEDRRLMGDVRLEIRRATCAGLHRCTCAVSEIRPLLGN